MGMFKAEPAVRIFFPECRYQTFVKGQKRCIDNQMKANENHNSRLNNAFIGLSCLYLEDESHRCVRAMDQSPILWGLRLSVTHSSQTVMLF